MAQFELHNKFEFIVRDAETEEIIETAVAHNIILNNFWTAFLSSGSSTSIFSYIHFGTGTVTPVVTDVKLTGWLGYKAAGTKVVDFSKYVSDGYITIVRSCRLEDTEYNGSAISEVGISAGTSGTSGLLTKALLKDQNGNVVAINKVAGQVVDIIVTFYAKVSATYQNGEVLMGGYAGGSNTVLGILTFDATWTNLLANVWLSCLPQVGIQTSAIDSFTEDYAQTSTVAFDVANKKATVTIPNIVAASGNLGNGIRSILLGSRGGLWIRVPNANLTQPVITKEVVGTGDGSNKKFNTAFGYIKDNGTLKAYVNDVEVPVTSVKYNMPHPRSDITASMIPLTVFPQSYDASGYPLPIPAIGASGYHSLVKAGSYCVFENPCYQYGLDSANIYSSRLYASDSPDSGWELAVTGSGGGAYSIPSAYKNKRYWKFELTSDGSSNNRFYELTSAGYAAEYMIELASAPAAGATVAITYQPDCIAKDANHVINNNTVVFQFGEYTP